MRSKALFLVALLVAPAVSSAQSMVQRPKQSAERAVAKTNAHTAAMTMTDTSAGRVATPPAAPRNAMARGSDTTRGRLTTSKRMPNSPERTLFEREIFSYERGGRRDPFISLMTTGDIRPLLADLRLVGIAYDVNGRNSVAVLREDALEYRVAKKGTTVGSSATAATDTVPMYRVREGQQIGRMRVARIGPKSITFTIEEFGFSRQETLTLNETNTEKKP